METSIAPVPASVCVETNVISVPILAPVAADSFEVFWQKPATKKEAKRLADADFPDFAGHSKSPLPDGVEGLGALIVTLTAREPRTALKYAGVGICLLVAFGCFCATILSVVLTIHRGDPKGTPFIVSSALVMIIMLVIAVGVYFARAYTNSTNRDYWLCEHGLAWQDAGETVTLRWHEIDDAFFEVKATPFPTSTMKLRLAKLLAGGKLEMRARMLRIVVKGDSISFFSMVQNLTNPLTAAFCNFLMPRAAEAAFKPALERIWAGESVSFGAVDIDRAGIRWGDESLAWADIERVMLIDDDGGTSFHEYRLSILIRGVKEPIEIEADSVSLPDTVRAICQTMLKEAPKLPAVPAAVVQPREAAPNPFDFG
jgi:hypothetical protein